MLVFCEECGIRYSFPPEKVDPDTGTFRCKECGFLMPVAVFHPEEYKKMNQQPSSPNKRDSFQSPRDGDKRLNTKGK